jgi:hypothetical protein
MTVAIKECEGSREQRREGGESNEQRREEGRGSREQHKHGGVGCLFVSLSPQFIGGGWLG